MASQIFPHNIKVDMGSKIQFSGIDWSSVESNMKNQRFAKDNSDEIIEAIANLVGKPVEDVKEVIEDFMPDSDDSTHDHGMDDEMDMGDEGDDEGDKKGPHVGYGPEDEDEDEDEDEGPDGMSHRMASGRKMTRIAFTSPKQISAEAIEAAIAKGDQKLVNTILAARKENRLRIASAIENKMKKEALASRKALRMKIAMGDMGDMDGTDGMGPYSEGENAGQGAQNPYSPGTPEFDAWQDGFNAQKGDMAGSNDYQLNDTGDSFTGDSNSSDGSFTSASQFTQTQRLAFNKAARLAGFPEEYISAMTPMDPKVSQLNQKVKEVFASSMSSDVKTTVVKTLVKEAKLSAESKNEFVHYWNDVLGYQDKDFWPAVAADYDAGKRVS